MSVLRRVSIVVGTATLGYGFAILVGAVPPLSLSGSAVTFVGFLAVAQGLRHGLGRRRIPGESAETADPELRFSAPAPGDDADCTIREGWGEGRWQRRDDARRELRAAAVETLVAKGEYDREEAEAAIEAGTWTEDAVATAFLRAEPTPLPWREGLQRLVRGQRARSADIGRTIDAIAALQEDDR